MSFFIVLLLFYKINLVAKKILLPLHSFNERTLSDVSEKGQFLPTLSQQYGSVFERKFFKKVEIKFGEKKKVTTFALPNEMRVLKRAGLGSS